MSYKRVLTIQDISCVGQCSLTVALPILSAAGLETCILPSAVLSTHTAGFTGYTFRDLQADIPKIAGHWEKEGIFFDALYTGYLGTKEMIKDVLHIAKTRIKPGGPVIIDPAMGDNGKLYPGFDLPYAEAMKELVRAADIVIPNITEACFLTGLPYKEQYDEAYIRALSESLLSLGAKNVVLTGVSYEEGKLGIYTEGGGKSAYYEHEKISKGCHGTGDVYASAFVGAYMNGRTMEEGARIAADFTVACIENTQDDPTHFYGVKFEPVLPKLWEDIRK